MACSKPKTHHSLNYVIVSLNKIMYIYMYIYMCMHVHAEVNIAIYDFMHIMYVCVCVCVCVYIYIFRKRNLYRNMGIHRVFDKLFDYNARRGIFVAQLLSHI